MPIDTTQTIAPVSLPRAAAAAYLGVSLRAFAELLKDSDFPKAIALGGPRSSRWLRPELDQYLATRPRRAVDDEPASLKAARLAKAAGRPVVPAPFGGVAV